MAAAECSMGMVFLAKTLDTIVASRKVQVPDSHSGSKMPLKKAAGLNKAFLSACKHKNKHKC